MRDRESQSADRPPIVSLEELEEITRRLHEAAVVDEPSTRDALRLVETIQVLREALEDTLDDFEFIGILQPHIRERVSREARVNALREAASLIRDGAGADRLEEIASAAESESATFEELAEELGIDLDAIRREDSQ